MATNSPERRYFSRILFSSRAFLIQGNKRSEVQLIDLSLKGALIHKPLQWQQSDTDMQLVIELEDKDVEIRMDVEISHDNDERLGLECIHTDIDSISHLRRLIELNTGDEAILQRELLQLISQHDA